MTKLWTEIWTRPGDASYGRVIDDPGESVATLHDGLNQIGDGTLQITNQFTRFDEILLADPSTPANAVSSTVKVFSEEDPTTPIFEWLPNKLYPSTQKNDPLIRVEGLGIKSILAHARLEAYDWDGSDDFEPSQPDWEWGARNVLGNPGFEESPVTQKVFELEITATGGTFTLTDGTDTTSAIAYNALPATIETRIQTDLGLFDDVVVIQVGTSPVTHLIQMVDPEFGVNLGINTGSLTGGSATTVTTTEGGLSPAPWTKARTLASGAVVGNYDEFAVTTANPHTGTYSLVINPGAVGATTNRNAGAQQVVGVTPGAVYQASIWVYPTSASDRFRFAIFGTGEELLFYNSANGTTLTANTWNEITLSDMLMPDDVNQIIVRIQCTNLFPSDPSVFYVDDGELYKGFAPTTFGEIFRLIYEHAIDTTLRTPNICWEIGATGLPYLTLDFDDTNDSGGNAWADSEIERKLTMRQSYSQIMAGFARDYGYEYRMVADDVEAGTYLLQVYNPGGMQTDYTTSASPAIQGGASDIRRLLSRFLATGSNTMVEGLGRVTARDQNTDLMGAIGRIEASELNREAPDLTAVADAATESISKILTNSDTYSYTLAGELQDEPMSDYVIGDLLIVDDPPEVVAQSERFIDVVCSYTPNSTEFDVQFGSVALLNPDAAVASAVAGLLAKFEYPETEEPGAAFIAGEGGGAPTIVVAASNASDWSMDKADMICTGSDDHEVIMGALLELFNASGGRVLLTEGTFNIDPDEIIVGYSASYPVPMILQGLGESTILNVGSSASSYAVLVADNCKILDLSIGGTVV